MSFLTENLLRQARLVPRAISIQAPRSFHTSLIAQRTATETVKDGVKKVDRAVSDKLVDGINAGAAVGNKIKEGVNEVASSDTAGKAAELRGKASGKASELEGQAKGAAKEAKGKVEGAVNKAQSKI